MGCEQGQREIEEIPRLLELAGRHLVVPFSKLGENNKKELSPREKDQDESC